MRQLRFLFSLFSLSALLSSCMVGPDFHPPPLPQTDRYTECPIPVKTIAIPSTKIAGAAQYFIAGRDIPGAWWHLFHSCELDQLIRIGIRNSPNLLAAKAAIAQAQETFNAQVGTSLLPNINGQFTGQRGRPGGPFLQNTASPLFNLFNASVNVTYTLDLFGGARRELESLCAQVNFEKFEWEAAYLTLTSNIVTTAITIASLRAQIHATLDLIRAQAEEYDIIKKQFELGSISETDVFSQAAELNQTRATLPPLKQKLDQNKHALSVLIGQLPCADQLPDFSLKKFHLPTLLPTSLPALLVRQRPDVRAAEALMHSAHAQIGVATANLYPQLSLNANYGWQGAVLSSLFQPTNKIWSIGAALTQPIFYGGALLAQRRFAIDAYIQAAAQYRQIVLQAFQNVADTLRALEHDAQTLKAQTQAEIAAKNAFDLTRTQYTMGSIDYVTLLVTERTYHQARINRIQAEAARFADTAALFQALGGGWWNRRINDICI